MSEKITVGMAEFRVVNNPCILECIGVGSCIAICLFDKTKKVGGLAHIMLGKSKSAADVNPLRFADKAIDAMLEEMRRSGCKRENIRAKIFGGASMFSGLSEELRVGNRNITAVRGELKQEGIQIVAGDVGGNQGRSIWFDTSDGSVVVSKVRGPTERM